MLNKLQQAEESYLHLEASLSSPEIMSNPTRCAAIMKEYKSLTPVIEKYRAYLQTQKEIDDALFLSFRRGAIPSCARLRVRN